MTKYIKTMQKEYIPINNCRSIKLYRENGKVNKRLGIYIIIRVEQLNGLVEEIFIEPKDDEASGDTLNNIEKYFDSFLQSNEVVLKLSRWQKQGGEE